MNKITGGNFFRLNPKRAASQPTLNQTSLAYQVINPLSNISLANEMMEVNVADGDMKLFSEIIRRNCNRINKLIVEFSQR
jgi:nitrogen-specific signal transduction histidine kinase